MQKHSEVIINSFYDKMLGIKNLPTLTKRLVCIFDECFEFLNLKTISNLVMKSLVSTALASLQTKDSEGEINFFHIELLLFTVINNTF